MKRIVVIIFLIVISSLYYFPVRLIAFSGVNTKMLLAVMGLFFFVWRHVKNRRPIIRKDFLPILVWGLLLSLSSYFSVVYNETDDFVFATYFVSMCVWLGGAYCVVYLLRCVYGSTSICIVFGYIALVCVMQCVLAILIDIMPTLRNMVDEFLGYDSEYFDKNSRLYGIGAAFDTAGIRFSCGLLGLSYLIKNCSSQSQKNFCVLLLLVIGIVGNMISRTTVVGLAMACVYLLFSSFSCLRARVTSKHILWVIGLCIILLILFYAGMYMYNNMPGAKRTFNYAFEGFINLYKTGSFSTHSSDLLLNNLTVVYPDNMRTWLFGDGYFADPYNPGAFYMGTDIGYIRFIFYSGLLGLALFIGYFACCTYVLCRREKIMNLFFVCLFVTQLIVWIKIPTDIFCFYALLLLVDTQREAVGNVLESNDEARLLSH